MVAIPFKEIIDTGFKHCFTEGFPHVTDNEDTIQQPKMCYAMVILDLHIYLLYL